ncbi:MAG: Ig-like domain-containing protein [Bacteroidales bacterium]|nr:Ig-like domain-containing protein [Bacteroidales bacterium]
MKNLFKFIAPVAVAAIALVACQKEISAPENHGEVHISVKAVPQALANEDTKTYIDNTQTILWGTDEYMKIAVAAGENTAFANSSSTSADAFDGEPEAMFEFDITTGEADIYTYMGLYPASAAVAANNTNAANYKVNLPATQNATANSYDPAAYIMVAQPEDFTSVQTSWLASYRRATALNKITLKNVPSGVSIKRVKITAPAGKYFAGARHINLSTGESGDIYSGGGRTETVEVKYATPVAGGSNIDVWFTSWDVEVAEAEILTIVVYTTDQKSYTKEITVPSGKSIKFQEGYLNTLGANMSGISPEDVTELEEGSYVVLAKDGTNYYALKAEKESGKERLLSVEYTGSISSYQGSADIVWNLTKSGDSFIFENDSKYLGYKGNSNESYWLASDENWTETNYLLDVTAQATAGLYYVTVHSSSSRYLSKNSSSAFFAFYGNTGQKADIVFVPATVDTRTDVTLSFDEDVITLTTADYGSFLGQDVIASPEVTAITNNLSWSFVDNDDVIDDFDGGVLTLTGTAGTATVTVEFAGDNVYRAASASYIINVSDASEMTLTFPFTSAISDWPSSSSDSAAGSYVYPLSGTDYTFTHTKSGNGIYCQTSYLMICSGNYLGLPAISGFRLKSVSAQLNPGGNPSTLAKGTITSNTSGTVVSGGEVQTFDTKGGSKTFNLTGTQENTVYYLAISNKNFQCTEIVLEYEMVEPDTRVEAGMSWSAQSASASITDTGVEFDAPTLILGHAHDVTYTSTNTAVATISNAGVVSVLAEGNTTIQAVFIGDDDYLPATVEYTLEVTDNRTPEATTIADVLAGGAGTYEVDDVLVYAVKGNALILGDATGKMYAYKSSHGLSAGAVRTVSGSAEKTSSGVFEFNGPTFTGSGTATVDHGTAVDFDAQASSLQTTFTNADNICSAVYIHATGTQSGRNITTAGNKVLYLSAAETATDGQAVEVYGYVYAYSSSYSNFNFLVTSIEVDNSTPTISVSPASLSWASDEYGSTNAKTLSVSLNGAAAVGDYNISGSNSEWTVSKNGNTITVYPNAENTSTTDPKSITLTIAHASDATVYQEVVCSQTKASSGSFTPFNVWEDSFSSCVSGSSALTSLSGSTSGFTGSYSSISTTYPMDGAIRVGKASEAGSITTPVLSTISGSSADLTVTFKAAGWNGKTAKITLSVNKGSVTEGQTTIASESTMSGTNPTMTGSTYTFHITGADNTTKITFATTNSIGIDDLVVTQTAN